MYVSVCFGFSLVLCCDVSSIDVLIVKLFPIKIIRNGGVCCVRVVYECCDVDWFCLYETVYLNLCKDFVMNI